MNNIYFIADLHLGVHNHRTLEMRGFKSDWQAHENYVIQRINDCCEKNDFLYILGDVGHKDEEELLEKFFRSLKCNSIFVAIGNHDNKKQLQKLKDHNVIQDVKESYNLIIGNNYFHLAHFPKREWEYFYDNGYHLYGHCHGKLPNYLRSMDIGIDNIGYTPYSVYEVVSVLGQYRNIDENRKRIDL